MADDAQIPAEDQVDNTTLYVSLFDEETEDARREPQAGWSINHTLLSTTANTEFAGNNARSIFWNDLPPETQNWQGVYDAITAHFRAHPGATELVLHGHGATNRIWAADQPAEVLYLLETLLADSDMQNVKRITLAGCSIFERLGAEQISRLRELSAVHDVEIVSTTSELEMVGDVTPTRGDIVTSNVFIENRMVGFRNGEVFIPEQDDGALSDWRLYWRKAQPEWVNCHVGQTHEQGVECTESDLFTTITSNIMGFTNRLPSPLGKD